MEQSNVSSISETARPRTPARKDSTGQEQVTKPQVVGERSQELEVLYNELRDARADFNEAIKACAEDSGYNAAAVRAHIVAKCNDRTAQARARAAQQLELFDALS
jgi:hypothetical protein